MRNEAKKNEIVEEEATLENIWIYLQEKCELKDQG